MQDRTVLEFIPFHEKMRAEWDSFVRSCAAAWLYHLSDFVIYSSKSPTRSDASFCVRSGGRIVGLAALAVERRGFGKILVGPGLALGPELVCDEERLYEEIDALARRRGCTAIRLHLTSLTQPTWGLHYFDSPLARHAYSFGHRGNSMDYEAGTWVVSDLRRSEAAILANFTQGHKGKVRKCEKSDFACAVVDSSSLSQENWRGFVDNHIETCARTGMNGFDAAHLNFLRDNIVAGRAILINAYLNGACKASIYIYVYKDAGYYEAAGCADDALRTGIMVYINYFAMRELKGRSIRFYCLGPDVPCMRNSKNGRISNFKRQLGDQKWDVLIGEKVLDRRAHWLRLVIPTFFKAEIAELPWGRRVRKLKRALLHAASHPGHAGGDERLR